MDENMEGVKIITRAVTSDVMIGKKMERYLKLGSIFLKRRYGVIMNTDVFDNGIIYYYLSFDDFVKVIDANAMMVGELMKERPPNKENEYVR